MDKYCITIARQFGSLGRSIAHELSEILGIEFYDRDIVEETSKKMDLPIATISEHEEKSIKSNFFNLLFPLGIDSIEKQDKIFKIQQQIILDLADKQSCIIVGRCADYILRDKKNCLNVFIYAPEEARFQNCVTTLGMKPEEAKKMIHDMDLAREQYWKRYANYSASDFRHKHIMIDSSLFGVKGTAVLLADIIKKKFLLEQ